MALGVMGTQTFCCMSVALLGNFECWASDQFVGLGVVLIRTPGILPEKRFQ